MLSSLSRIDMPTSSVRGMENALVGIVRPDFSAGFVASESGVSFDNCSGHVDLLNPGCRR